MTASADHPLVIAYDGSDDASSAIGWAGRLLAPWRALVMHSFVGLSQLLLHSNVEDVSGQLAEAVEEIDSADAEQAQRLVSEGTELALEAGLEAQPLVVRQHRQTWRTIIATASKHRGAAIVAGTRGRSALASALLGSVSTGLVTHSPVPVLIVPAGAPVEAAGGPTLLCYDGSEAGDRAIAAAGRLVSSRSALVLRVWQSWLASVSVPAPGIAVATERMAAELDEIAESQAARDAQRGVAQATQAGFDAAPLTLRRDSAVWRGILDAADEHDASLLVLGSRGLGPVSGLIGSVSRPVMHHVGRAVLVVPPPASEQAGATPDVNGQ